jgi:hypothetical protein
MKKVENEFTNFEDLSKLTPEELSNLQSLVSEYNNLQLKCGDLEIQKHQLLHKVGMISASLDTLQNSLKEVYGDVIIDINTGTFKPKPNEISS